MLSSVTALPAEVLLNIIDYLYTHRDRLNLATASSRLYSNLRPSAYVYLELYTRTPRKLEQLIYFLSRDLSLARWGTTSSSRRDFFVYRRHDARDRKPGWRYAKADPGA